MTTNPKFWVTKTRFRITFFRRERFRRNSSSEKLEKMEGEVTRKKRIRKKVNSDTKASPGRTDAKVQICLQTQTSCRLEKIMDDHVAAVTVGVAAYRRRKQRIKNINQLALVLGLLGEEDAIVVPRTYL